MTGIRRASIAPWAVATALLTLCVCQDQTPVEPITHPSLHEILGQWRLVKTIYDSDTSTHWPTDIVPVLTIWPDSSQWVSATDSCYFTYPSSVPSTYNNGVLVQDTGALADTFDVRVCADTLVLALDYCYPAFPPTGPPDSVCDRATSYLVPFAGTLPVDTCYYYNSNGRSHSIEVLSLTPPESSLVTLADTMRATVRCHVDTAEISQYEYVLDVVAWHSEFAGSSLAGYEQVFFTSEIDADIAIPLARFYNEEYLDGSIHFTFDVSFRAGPYSPVWTGLVSTEPVVYLKRPLAASKTQGQPTVRVSPAPPCRRIVDGRSLVVAPCCVPCMRPWRQAWARPLPGRRSW